MGTTRTVGMASGSHARRTRRETHGPGTGKRRLLLGAGQWVISDVCWGGGAGQVGMSDLVASVQGDSVNQQ